MKLVSVVIPCFNAGKFLDEAVQSALSQTWTNLEVVIVDDGSSDAATIQLLSKARWPRTRILHQTNAGPAAARNRAIRAAHGEYILPLDADDTIHPTYVEKAVAVLDSREDVGCVYCKATKFGDGTGPWDLPPYRPEELAVDNVIFVTALFRKADWQTVGGFDEQLRHGVEDYDFWVKMVASGKNVVQLDEFLFNYRVQEKSRTKRFQDGLDDKIATYAKIFRNNIRFYATHAEILFKHRFDLYAQNEDWRSKCERLEFELERSKTTAWARLQEQEATSKADLAYWKTRYGEIDAFFERHAWLRKAIGRVKTWVHGRSARHAANAPPPPAGDHDSRRER